ncbi:hypothetical protein [Streptomyces thermodiastaticus]|uniref:hypothetical protein n=1 Tax=Streptomyces thermodiastaticus TaxID=44061 RepID=UPI0019A9E6E0|nr:hypothetical protein [Streptomyces thermodiastaticus]MCE7551314.1 hypothetical protein [Streptomyces thermodiastaticus]GHF93327.1 hypothetical protein GCM10018787_47660 [Streptomyces thermodiastaticus]
MTTTELGLSLLPYAQDVLDGVQRLRRAAGAAQRSAARTVGVGGPAIAAAARQAFTVLRGR